MGRICKDCEQDMLTAESCTMGHVQDDDTKFWPRDTSYYDINERCHDCGIANKPGNIHHFGCDIERCPKCGGQFAFCNCWPEYITLTDKP